MAETSQSQSPNQLRALLADYLYGKTRDDRQKGLRLLTAQLESLIASGASSKEAKQIIGTIALIAPLQLFRTSRHLEIPQQQTSALIAALKLGGEGSAPIAIGGMIEEELKQVRELASANGAPPSWRPETDLHLIGYDPRFLVGDAKARWKQCISQTTAATSSTPPLARPQYRLCGTYREAKKRIYTDFHSADTRYDVFLIDYVWLTELQHHGHVVALDAYADDINNALRKAINRAKIKDDAADAWFKLLRTMAQAGNSSYYAYPISLNFHNQLRSSKTAASDIQLMDASTSNIAFRAGCSNDLANFLRGNTVQDARGACCAYQVYAHFAYHGARPIIRSDGGSPTVDFYTRGVRAALADYLIRLYATRTSEEGKKAKEDEWKVDQDEERRQLRIQERTGSICVSHELLADDSVRQQRVVMPPLHLRHGKNAYRFLTSFGGYGLAVSRHSVDVEGAMRFAFELFQRWSEEIFGEGGVPAGLPDLNTWTANAGLTDLIELHLRPRLHNWSHVEAMISMAVSQLYDVVVAELEGTSPIDAFAAIRSALLDDLEAKTKTDVEKKTPAEKLADAKRRQVEALLKNLNEQVIAACEEASLGDG